jgi:hypothetical protein
MLKHGPLPEYFHQELYKISNQLFAMKVFRIYSYTVSKDNIGAPEILNNFNAIILLIFQ